MATKNKPLNKVFVATGKIPVQQSNGKIVSEEQYIILSEELAKYIGATYTNKPPAPKKVVIAKGALKSSGNSPLVYQVLNTNLLILME
jgi:hypothetical protein